MALFAVGVFIALQTAKNLDQISNSPSGKVFLILTFAVIATLWSNPGKDAVFITSRTFGTAGLAILYHRLYTVLLLLGDALKTYVLVATQRRR